MRNGISGRISSGCVAGNYHPRIGVDSSAIVNVGPRLKEASVVRSDDPNSLVLSATCIHIEGRRSSRGAVDSKRSASRGRCARDRQAADRIEPAAGLSPASAYEHIALTVAIQEDICGGRRLTAAASQVKCATIEAATKN